MIREAVSKIIEATDLDEQEMIEVMNEIMSGAATDAQIAAFIIGLRMKGETVDEIVGAAKVMREKATRVTPNLPGGVLADTCGTGGDASGTFNVSTTTALVLASGGVPVAKHGNRSISSHCGSADVLEALGVDLNLSPARIAHCIEEVGIGFMFAPMLHGAMKYAIGPRREIGVRTIFNILGPLTNPAGANVQIMGVFAPDLVIKLAQVLGQLGAKRALVVCGQGGMDEITLTGETLVADFCDGRVATYTIRPEEFGLTPCTLAELKGGQTASESAAQLQDILQGTPGPMTDMVLLNSGAALMAAGKADDLAQGIAQAGELIHSGAATAKLKALVAFCRKN